MDGAVASPVEMAPAVGATETQVFRPKEEPMVQDPIEPMSRKRPLEDDDDWDGSVPSDGDARSKRAAKKKTVVYKESHNAIEKRRRDKINQCIQELSSMIPGCVSTEQRADKSTVLSMAVGYVKKLLQADRGGMDESNGDPNEFARTGRRPTHAALRLALQGGMSSAGKPPFMREQEWNDLLLENVDDMLFVVTTSGRLTHVSPSCQGIVGHRAAALVDHRLIEFAHPDDVALVQRQLASGERNKDFVFRMRRADGEYAWLAVRGKQLLNHGVPSDYIVAVGRIYSVKRIVDMSDPLEIEGEFVSKHTLHGVFTYASPNATRIFGHHVHDLIGQSAYLFHHPEDIQRISAIHRDVLSTVKELKVTYRFVTNTGDYVWIESNAHMFVNPVSKMPEFILVRSHVTGGLQVRVLEPSSAPVVTSDDTKDGTVARTGGEGDLPGSAGASRENLMRDLLHGIMQLRSENLHLRRRLRQMEEGGQPQNAGLAPQMMRIKPEPDGSPMQAVPEPYAYDQQGHPHHRAQQQHQELQQQQQQQQQQGFRGQNVYGEADMGYGMAPAPNAPYGGWDGRNGAGMGMGMGMGMGAGPYGAAPHPQMQRPPQQFAGAQDGGQRGDNSWGTPEMQVPVIPTPTHGMPAQLPPQGTHSPSVAGVAQHAPAQGTPTSHSHIIQRVQQHLATTQGHAARGSQDVASQYERLQMNRIHSAVAGGGYGGQAQGPVSMHPAQQAAQHSLQQQPLPQPVAQSSLASMYASAGMTAAGAAVGVEGGRVVTVEELQAQLAAQQRERASLHREVQHALQNSSRPSSYESMTPQEAQQRQRIPSAGTVPTGVGNAWGQEQFVASQYVPAPETQYPPSFAPAQYGSGYPQGGGTNAQFMPSQGPPMHGAMGGAVSRDAGSVGAPAAPGASVGGIPVARTGSVASGGAAIDSFLDSILGEDGSGLDIAEMAMGMGDL
eukprot:Opistho-1_new@30036